MIFFKKKKKKKKESKKEKKKKENRKKIRFFVLFLIFVAILVFLLIITEAYLYFRLLLGHDLIVKVNIEKQHFFLKHGETDKVEIKPHVITNIFCDANCDYSFIDLSNNNVLDKGEFSFKITNLRQKEYEIIPPDVGTGQKIYRFDLECQSEKDWFCHTEEKKLSRSEIVTLNYYLNEEEGEYLNNSKEIILSDYQDLHTMFNNYDLIKNKISEINDTIDLTDFYLIINDNWEDLKNINESFIEIIETWRKQDINQLKDKISVTAKKLDNEKKSFNFILNLFEGNLTLYNNLVDDMGIIESNLSHFSDFYLTNDTAEDINSLIRLYNNKSKNFILEKNIRTKKSIVEDLLIGINNTNRKIQNDLTLGVNLTSKPDEVLDQVSLSKIYFNQTNSSVDLEFGDLISTCCLFGKCEECCGEECRNDKNKFPVLFIHGHDFSEAVSAENSLNLFEGVQRKLENDGLFNGGTLLIGDLNAETKGVLGSIVYPVSFKASYYFDIYGGEGGSVIIQTKTDNIDTYAIRLKDLIDIVKHKTGRDKVVLVTHSMGGLVARRYIQIFGEDSVSELIMITAPNSGISGKVKSYCSLFGTELECNDMNFDSLFINKVNRNIPSIPVKNIIGIGCDMDGENGDGIVTNKSAYVSYADNSYIKGSCNLLSFQMLHNEIINTTKYPKTYEIIRGSLNLTGRE